MKFFLIGSLFLTFLLTKVSAAPAPRYIAVNDQQNLCGEYWPGDEFGQNEFPKGWRIVDIDNFSPLECADLEYSNFNQDCCELIGYQYIEDIYLYTLEEEVEEENRNNEDVNTQDNKILWIIGGTLAFISITSLLLLRKKRSK